VDTTWIDPTLTTLNASHVFHLARLVKVVLMLVYPVMELTIFTTSMIISAMMNAQYLLHQI
jgi:hypothetical protein